MGGIGAGEGEHLLRGVAIGVGKSPRNPRKRKFPATIRPFEQESEVQTQPREYRSSATLPGLPLVHIVRTGSFGTKAKPAVGGSLLGNGLAASCLPVAAWRLARLLSVLAPGNSFSVDLPVPAKKWERRAGAGKVRTARPFPGSHREYSCSAPPARRPLSPRYPRRS